MLFRFSLYGFLKNQRYFEIFLMLALHDKGLSYGLIGTLYSFREICTAVMEIPTGAAADVVGRRRSMIASFVAYIGSFLVFGLTGQIWPLFAAMFFYSVGDAFRTGTHKAIIFDWLARQGRPDEKTKVYGFTRSWSQLGSAVGVVGGAGLLYAFGSYNLLFLASIIPYLANIVNFMTYPAELDGPHSGGKGIGEICKMLVKTLHTSIHSRTMRRLLIESMSFEGVFKVSKDYLQPVLAKLAVVALPMFFWADGKQKTAMTLGAVYVVLNLLGAVAARHAGALVEKLGSRQRAARWLWAMDMSAYAVMTVGMALGMTAAAVIAFVALAICQNFWRPILISRFAGGAGADEMATTLSIESQAKTLAAAVVASPLGFAVDFMPANIRFLPVALLGLIVTGVMLATSRNIE